MKLIQLKLLGHSDEFVVINADHIVYLLPAGPHHAIVCTTVERLHVIHSIEEIMVMINKSETDHASN